MNIILFIDRFFRKLSNMWRKYVFAKRINCPHRDFSLVGKVHLINTNIRLGRNVTIYPDVMFWGDGPIDIGDNVNIGIGTIIYSYHGGGGIHQIKHSHCRSMLYY